MPSVVLVVTAVWVHFEFKVVSIANGLPISISAGKGKFVSNGDALRLSNASWMPLPFC